MNEGQLIQRQIDDLSKVEISTDLIDQIKLSQLSEKAKDIVSELNKSKKGINEILDQGWYDFHKRIGGQNDKRLANAEKAVVDATKFNVGLSCLLVLFSKALKNQQDNIVEQQVKIKNQQDDILKLQGLTKEQADKIVEILSAEEYLNKQLRLLKDELTQKIEKKDSELSESIVKNKESVITELNSLTIKTEAKSSELLNTIQKNKESIESKLQSSLEQNSILLRTDFKNDLNQIHKNFRVGSRVYFAFSMLLIIAIVILYIIKLS